MYGGGCGGAASSIDVVTATLPLESPRPEWMPILEVCTQRRLCCAPSVHFLRTTTIL